MNDEPLNLPEAGETRRGRYAFEPDEKPPMRLSGSWESPAGPRLPEPASNERSPLSTLELHLAALSERIDQLPVEHALMRRLLHEAYAAGLLEGREQLAIRGDGDGWETFDLDDAEATILRALLAAEEEPDADE